jgi:hypothetical protein
MAWSKGNYKGLRWMKNFAKCVFGFPLALHFPFEFLVLLLEITSMVGSCSIFYSWWIIRVSKAKLHDFKVIHDYGKQPFSTLSKHKIGHLNTYGFHWDYGMQFSIEKKNLFTWYSHAKWLMWTMIKLNLGCPLDSQALRWRLLFPP